MDFLNPWGNIKIRELLSNEKIQYFDSRIHVVFVLYGEMTLRWDEGETVTLAKDDFVILSKTQVHQLQVPAKSKAFYFTFDYFGQHSHTNYLIAFKGSTLEDYNSHDAELITLFKQLLLLKTMPQEVKNSEIYKQYFTLITILEAHYTVELQDYKDKNVKSQIEDLKFYIDNNFEKNIRLSDLASQLFVTEQYLSKVFKEQTGIGVSEYLIKQRLFKVRQLLLETEDSITDIAFATGFSNINSFNRIFKKYQGLTPSHFRKAMKSDITLKNSIAEEEIGEKEVIQSYIKEDLGVSEVQEIVIDTQQKKPLKMASKMINLGYAGDLLQNSLVKEAQQTITYAPFSYGRIWGLLNQSILKQNGHDFDFSKVDEVIQNMLDMDLVPFIDLGFKGKAIHASVDSIISYELFTLPYRDMDSLLYRYHALMEHLIHKFGYDTVSTWKIELWRPNPYVLNTLGNQELAHWTWGDRELDLTRDDDYLDYFELVKSCLVDLVPEIEVGGSGISLNLEEDYDDFLRKWSQRKLKPDFLTFTSYSLDILEENDSRKPTRSFISANQDFISQNLIRARRIMEKYDISQKLYLSEFNLTNSARDMINDSVFKGSFILKNMLEIRKLCDVVGYWQLSDISFTSFDVNRREFFGGAGLISKNGIPKPSFYAVDFLNSLGDELIYMSDGIIVTQKRRKLMILLFHYSHLNSFYYFTDQDQSQPISFQAVFDQVPPKDYRFNLTGLTVKEYKVKLRRIGIHEGDALGEALKISHDDNYSREELSYLRYRSIPSLKRIHQTATEDGLKFDLQLAAHDMLLLEIE